MAPWEDSLTFWSILIIKISVYLCFDLGLCKFFPFSELDRHRQQDPKAREDVVWFFTPPLSSPWSAR